MIVDVDPLPAAIRRGAPPMDQSHPSTILQKTRLAERMLVNHLRHVGGLGVAHRQNPQAGEPLLGTIQHADKTKCLKILWPQSQTQRA